VKPSLQKDVSRNFHPEVDAGSAPPAVFFRAPITASFPSVFRLSPRQVALSPSSVVVVFFFALRRHTRPRDYFSPCTPPLFVNPTPCRHSARLTDARKAEQNARAHRQTGASQTEAHNTPPMRVQRAARVAALLTAAAALGSHALTTRKSFSVVHNRQARGAAFRRPPCSVSNSRGTWRGEREYVCVSVNCASCGSEQSTRPALVS
jgi:hypothetical protein